MRLSVRQFEGLCASANDKSDVVLIHGTGANGTLWQPQIKMLTQAGHRCIVPDLRGHGFTHEPEELTDLDVHMEDLHETLAHCRVKYPAVFIGHSLGAIILLQMAKQSPEMFSQLFAVSLPGKVPSIVSTVFSWFLCTPFELVRGTILHKSLPIRHRILIETERHSLEQIVEHFSKVNLVDKTHSVQCPVHLSVGRFDVVAPFIYVQKIHKLLPGSTLRIFEWAGHSCMDDCPDEFNQWLAEKICTLPANH